MPIRRHATACIAVLAGLLAAGTARAEPTYKDSERFGPAPAGPGWHDPAEAGRSGHGRLRPGRRVDGGPGYVGSDYGLGKPAFTGLGSRPDWGRSD